MSKGEETRATILAEAVAMASVQGLEGLSIGRVASQAGLSKSGLFAHFRSKEALQQSVLQHAIDRFIELVIQPSLAAPRGEPRLRTLFERWLGWDHGAGMPGGCPLITASIELDDRPGPLRDYLAEQQNRWIEFVAGAAQKAIDEGHFRADLDTAQFAFEFQSLALGFNHSMRLLRNPDARKHTLRGFESLLARARSS